MNFLTLHPDFESQPVQANVEYKLLIPLGPFCRVFENKIPKKMAVTRLKRKAKRNQAIAKNRIAEIKRLSLKTDIQAVDVEALKAEFAK
ncbi:hypothetical protein [Emticicia agri]|uniref:hypothetical protein n=1 Tax=Emticicia agri TaxID=2492393 RepID=UPI0010219224|nr:hypothetical protein [Emticicia agri]